MRKKLIEVALPLDAINDASAYDKMPGIGPHPKGIHQWWARLPLPCARAILFASVVDDPSVDPRLAGATEEAQDAERERLFRIIRNLLRKDVRTNSDAFSAAHTELVRASGGRLPVVLDPFSGGGSIPLEAQRLGFEAHAQDLNPVAVLVTKALVEFLPRFNGHAPVNPAERARGVSAAWRGAAGVAADIRFYAGWVQRQLEQRLAGCYPLVPIGSDHTTEATPVAWVWARTATCPNPACGASMPLIHSYSLSTKKGRQAWVEPLVDRARKTVSFKVVTGNGTPSDPPKVGRGATFRCLVCNQVAGDQHIKAEGMAGRLGTQLMAIVAERGRGRLYVSPVDAHEERANTTPLPEWLPEQPLANDPRNLWCSQYGLNTFDKLFTRRQLLVLTTISGLIQEVRGTIEEDARAGSRGGDGQSLGEGGEGAAAYADLVTLFLALALDRCADFNNSICRWNPSNEKVMNLFSRQAIPMAWDFAEANTLAGSVGGWITCSDYVAECVEVSLVGTSRRGLVTQRDSSQSDYGESNALVSTDPPYYDNISYANLSDFFYVWLRPTIGSMFPELFSTLLVPKASELVATPYLFSGDKQKAKEHFQSGFLRSLHSVRSSLHPSYPVTIYYAFKQSEEGGSGDSSVIDLTTGWETMLESLLGAGFQVTATWPVRASQAWRMVSMGVNALASYIVLVCRPRPADAPLAIRRQFTETLRKELPDALRKLQHGNIAPVDLAQAAIGPGMAVFSRYAKVVDASGEALPVRAALQIINQALDEVLAEQESEYDNYTRWAVAWFEQFGMTDGAFGTAETLSKAKDTAVAALEDAGILRARGGKVHLLSRDELPAGWDPAKDRRVTVWEVTQHLIRRLEKDGEQGGAELLAKVGGLGEVARDLAYRLYAICERKRWPQEALAYNSLVIAWPEMARLAAAGTGGPRQERLI